MTVFGIYLAEPLFLLGLLVLPFLLWRTVSLTGRGRVPVPREASVRALVSVRAALWWLPDGLRMLSVAVLVLALARPQVEGEETVAGEGVDIMLTLDMSGSMNAVDMSRDELEAVLEKDETPANRFLAARETLKQFIVNRSRTSHDRIGLVVFGQNAWLKYPLTLDHARLIHTLNDLVLDDGRRDRDGGSCMNACTIDGGGTAIGDALGRAFNQLRRSTAKSRIVILITDGKQTGSTLDARAIAKHIADLPPDERVRVYTFLVGGTDQVWLPDVDRFGRPLVDRDGHPVYARPRQPFPVDPELLQEIASLTGGKFYESYNEEKFKEDVQDLERTVFTAAVERPHHDRFALLVLVGLLLLAGEWVLRFTFFRSIV
ncbi:MAG: VWA domain-containing protein [Myxococcales bacterium]|nr:VWA domain-containing protein [Myxococcales bacterium]MCB9733002.1 VWA domain-containing protein [Deltaproteobacteria bacterium]